MGGRRQIPDVAVRGIPYLAPRDEPSRIADIKRGATDERGDASERVEALTQRLLELEAAVDTLHTHAQSVQVMSADVVRR